MTCLFNENDGSHWRYKEGDTYKRAKCRRGIAIKLTEGGGGKVGGGSVENLPFGVCRLYNSFSLQRAEVQILAIICISVAN